MKHQVIQNKVNKHRQSLGEKKRLSADIRGVLTPQESTKLNEVRPWSNNKSMKSQEKNKDTQQTIRRTSSIVGDLQRRQLIKDPFINVMKRNANAN